MEELETVNIKGIKTEQVEINVTKKSIFNNIKREVLSTIIQDAVFEKDGKFYRKEVEEDYRNKLYTTDIEISEDIYNRVLEVRKAITLIESIYLKS